LKKAAIARQAASTHFTSACAWLIVDGDLNPPNSGEEVHQGRKAEGL
jgi:hypothetical protein